MPLLGSALDSERYLVEYGDLAMMMTDYFGRPMDESVPGPQSHLVEPVSPDFRCPTHYHVQDQYQIFVDSTGRFGSRELNGGVTVQYADAYTPYGPYWATEGTLHFVTLRNRPDPGPKFITDPEARRAQRGKGGRQFMIDVDASAESGDVVTMLFDRGDGVAVWRMALAPGAGAVGPDPSASIAHYYVVIGGAIDYDGRLHPKLSHLCVAADEQPPTIVGGPDGAEVLVLGFRPSAA